MKERKDTFVQEHPKLVDNIEFVGVLCGVGLIWILPMFGSYQMGREEEREKTKADETKRILDRITEGPYDYIDKEGRYHEDIGYGCYAVWPNKEAYLEKLTKYVNEDVPELDL